VTPAPPIKYGNPKRCPCPFHPPFPRSLSPSGTPGSTSSMGALISSLFTRCFSLRLYKANNPTLTGRVRLPDVEECKTDGTTPKRRALLVGITYNGSKTWSRLDGPHGDVAHFQKLLIGVILLASSVVVFANWYHKLSTVTCQEISPYSRTIPNSQTPFNLLVLT
jgi:hypothetical protein